MATMPSRGRRQDAGGRPHWTRRGPDPELAGQAIVDLAAGDG
jgi:hypothetical protein